MMVALGNFFFRHRNSLFPLAFLIVLLPGPRIFDDPLLAAAVGCVVAIAGQVLRGATIGLQYIVRGGRDRRVYAADMVTDGVYAHCRNPMYVGNLLILVGVGLASNGWICIAVAVPLFASIYVAIVAAEEAYLLQRFGAAFEDYMHAVPRWIIRFKGLGSTVSQSRFHWRRAVVKEYGTPFGWVMGLFALALWNLWHAGQWTSRAQAVDALCVGMLVTVVIWAVIRSLKKSRALVAD